MKLRAAIAAFPHTLPIFAGFWFLGMAYGLYMHVSGFSFWYPLAMSITIFGGSLEFVAVTMLLAPYAPLQTFVVALLIQARHLFYGISMLERYKGMGFKKLYLIYGLCDESFAINHTATIPDGVDAGWFMFFVTLFNQLYWVSGSTLGGIIGPALTFNTTGLEFVLTAMFVVIFVDHWLKELSHIPSLIGLGASFVCLLVFGAEAFMVPAMVCILVCLALVRKHKRHTADLPEGYAS